MWYRMQCSYVCKDDGTNAGKNMNQQSHAQLEHFEELERTGVSPLESQYAYRAFLQMRLDALNLTGFTTITDHVRFCKMMHEKVAPEVADYGLWCEARRKWEAKVRNGRIASNRFGPPTSATEINTLQDAFDKTWEHRAKEFAKIFNLQPKKEETQMITVSTVTIATETAEKLQEKRMKHVVDSLQKDLEKDGCAHDNGQGLTVIQAEAIRVGFRKAGFVVTHGTGDKSTSTYIRVTFDTTGGV